MATFDSAAMKYSSMFKKVKEQDQSRNLSSSSVMDKQKANASSEPSQFYDERTHQLAKTFHSALVATQVHTNQKPPTLTQLTKSPAFQMLLKSMRSLALQEGLSDREAARTLIQTFRHLDQIWGDYLSQKGIEKLSEES